MLHCGVLLGQVLLLPVASLELLCVHAGVLLLLQIARILHTCYLRSLRVHFVVVYVHLENLLDLEVILRATLCRRD